MLPPPAHPLLAALVARAGERAAAHRAPRVGIVYPCDAFALVAAARVLEAGIATPVLIGPRAGIARAAGAAAVELQRFEIVDTGAAPAEAALHATTLVRAGALQALMKGSLHTDELMAAIVERATGLRGATRISHAFLFDLPRYHKLLALADCVVNITPHLPAKRDILTNAIRLLQDLGIAQPKVAIVAAVETVNPAIPVPWMRARWSNSRAGGSGPARSSMARSASTLRSRPRRRASSRSPRPWPATPTCC